MESERKSDCRTRSSADSEDNSTRLEARKYTREGCHLWTSTCDLVTYRFFEQQMLRWACAFVQTRQSIRCSYTQSMDIYEVSPFSPLDASARAFKLDSYAYAISFKISHTGPYNFYLQAIFFISIEWTLWVCIRFTLVFGKCLGEKVKPKRYGSQTM